MKKAFFFIVAIITLVLLVDIGTKLINDIDRLTEYGWGYITGRIILLIVFSVITFVLYKKTFAKK